MNRPRFSLRTLLFLTAIISAVSAWIARPVVVANRFAAAVADEDYAAAKAMCHGTETSAPSAGEARFEELLLIAGRSGLGFILGVHLAPRTWSDILRGRTPIRFQTEVSLSAPEVSGREMEIDTLCGYATMSGIRLLHR